MPTFTYGAKLPDIKQIELDRQFKYNLWSSHLKEFELYERLLATLGMNARFHIKYCVQVSEILIRMWNLIRSAFSKKTRAEFDLVFDGLRDLSQREYNEYQRLRIRSAPYDPDPTPPEELVKMVHNGERFIAYMADKCGFGNETLPVYDDRKNMFER